MLYCKYNVIMSFAKTMSPLWFIHSNTLNISAGCFCQISSFQLQNGRWHCIFHDSNLRYPVHFLVSIVLAWLIFLWWRVSQHAKWMISVHALTFIPSIHPPIHLYAYPLIHPVELSIHLSIKYKILFKSINNPSIYNTTQFIFIAI